MFILVSLPAVLAGCIIPFVLADSPNKASWLSDSERATLQAMLADEPTRQSHANFATVVGNMRVFLLAITQFGFLVASYGIGIWLPQMLKRQDLSNMRVSEISALPYLVAVVGQVVWATYSDKKDNAITNVVISSLLAAIGLAISISSASFTVESASS